MTALQVLQLVVAIVALLTAVGTFARSIFVTEVKVARLEKDVEKVEVKATSTNSEVTGPVNVKAARLEGQIANVEGKLDGHINDFKSFLAEYRADQHRGRRS